MLPNRKPVPHPFLSASIFSITLFAMALFAAPMGARALSLGIGPIGGVNLGDAAVDGHENTEMRTGLALGGRVEVGVTNPYSLLIEPQYVQKGARFDVSAAPFGSIKAKGDLDYLEIPVLLKAKFGAMKAHGYAIVGPSMGINLKAKGSFGTFSDTFKSEAETLTFAGDLGLGAGFQIQKFVYLTGDARYSLGFTDALNKQVGDVDSWKARDIRFLAGVLIHITE